MAIFGGVDYFHAGAVADGVIFRFFHGVIVPEVVVESEHERVHIVVVAEHRQEVECRHLSQPVVEAEHDDAFDGGVGYVSAALFGRCEAAGRFGGAQQVAGMIDEGDDDGRQPCSRAVVDERGYEVAVACVDAVKHSYSRYSSRRGVAFGDCLHHFGGKDTKSPRIIIVAPAQKKGEPYRR